MMIAAVLVCFDPSRDPRAAAARLLEAVDSVVVVDNCAEGHPALGTPFDDGAILLRNANVGGLAGAYNGALDWIGQHRPETTHVLFVDDDTDLHALRSFLTSAETLVAANSVEVAAVAPIYRDRRTGLRGSHIRLERFRFHFLPRELSDPVDVTFIINSMSLWRRDALNRLGPYSTFLAVDHIDTEYAMRAKRAGYRIVLNATVEFIHEIGNRRSYRFFGRTVQTGGHSARRRYLIGRNTMAVARLHGLAYPAFATLCLQRLGYETIGILVAEDHKTAKLVNLWRGAIAGLVGHA